MYFLVSGLFGTKANLGITPKHRSTIQFEKTVFTGTIPFLIRKKSQLKEIRVCGFYSKLLTPDSARIDRFRWSIPLFWLNLISSLLMLCKMRLL